MLVIQFLLLCAVLGLTFYFLSRRRGAQVSALVTLGFLAFMLLAVYAALRPSDVTRLAKLLGVGRGSDLLLYGLVIGFAVTTVSSYLRFHDLENQYTRLTRSLALERAHRENGERPADGADETIARSVPASDPVDDQH